MKRRGFWREKRFFSMIWAPLRARTMYEICWIAFQKSARFFFSAIRTIPQAVLFRENLFGGWFIPTPFLFLSSMRPMPISPDEKTFLFWDNRFLKTFSFSGP